MEFGTKKVTWKPDLEFYRKFYLFVARWSFAFVSFVFKPIVMEMGIENLPFPTDGANVAF
jgi:hypothetical protein